MPIKKMGGVIPAKVIVASACEGGIAIRTFEECYPEIEKIVERVRQKWTLDAVPHVSFDDIKSIIVAHIYKKWSQYKQDLPLANWVATITKRQFINQLRNLYLSTQKPCSDCPCDLGNDQCSLFGTHSEECGPFAVWKKTKFNQHQARLPLPIENHQHEVYSKDCSDFDYDAAIIKLTSFMRKQLKPNEWKVYEALYVLHKSDEEVARMMGFKTSEAGRKVGYRRIMQIKKDIIKLAKQHLLG
jgi:hypothetical protein